MTFVLVSQEAATLVCAMLEADEDDMAVGNFCESDEISCKTLRRFPRISDVSHRFPCVYVAIDMVLTLNLCRRF